MENHRIPQVLKNMTLQPISGARPPNSAGREDNTAAAPFRTISMSLAVTVLKMTIIAKEIIIFKMKDSMLELSWKDRSKLTMMMKSTERSDGKE